MRMIGARWAVATAALAAALTTAQPAAAAPGSLDRTFGRGGMLPQTFGRAFTVLADGRVVVPARAEKRLRLINPRRTRKGYRIRLVRCRGNVTLLDSGRVLVRGRRSVRSGTLPAACAKRAPKLGSALGDTEYSPFAPFGSGWIVSKPAPTPSCSPRYGQPGCVQAAELAHVYVRDGAGRVTVDIPFEVTGDQGRVTALAAGSAGRIFVATEQRDAPGLVRRFLADGTPDPAFAPVDMGHRVDRIIPSPDGVHVALYSDEYELDLRAVAGNGRVMPLERGNGVAMAWDRKGRIVYDGQRTYDPNRGTGDQAIMRFDPARGRREVIRRSVPGGPRRHVRVLSVAVDRQGRILLGGYRLTSFFSGCEPIDSGVCRDDEATTRDFIIRLKGDRAAVS